MAKIDPSLSLNQDEIEALMSRCAHCRIATVGANGLINLTPMTFGWANGKVYIFARGQKVANLRRQSTATVLVDVGETWRELAGIMLQGHAKVLEDAEAEAADADLNEAQRNLGEKHGLTKDGQPAAYRASASGRSRRWIVFSADRVVSWDNHKLP